MLTHIVMFRMNDRNREYIEKARDLLLGMNGRIPQLRYLEVGTDILHTERSYDIVLITKFDSLEDMQAYQVHPVHLEVAEYIGTVRESAAAVDYES